MDRSNMSRTATGTQSNQHGSLIPSSQTSEQKRKFICIDQDSKLRRCLPHGQMPERSKGIDSNELAIY
jgi:hypothetical protein